MLEEIIKKLKEIKQIMYKYGAKEWKVFGEAIGDESFPSLADAHFLITPGPGLHHGNWLELKRKLRPLFTDKHLGFYTPDSLDSDVKHGYLTSTAAEHAKTSALNADQLLELYKKTQKAKSVTSNSSASLFKQDNRNNTVAKTNTSHQDNSPQTNDNHTNDRHPRPIIAK